MSLILKITLLCKNTFAVKFYGTPHGQQIQTDKQELESI